MPKILELSSPLIVLCTVDIEVAARRQIERGLQNPEREFYHGDNRVVHYKKTGEFLPPADYEVPNLNAPTIEVSTDGEYIPSIDEIIKRIQSSVTGQGGEPDAMAGVGDA